MSRTLALAGAIGNVDGPWLIANGQSAEVRVRGLSKGEHVQMHVESVGSLSIVFNEPGVFPLYLPRGRYKMQKVGASGVATTVEVVKYG